MLTGDVNNMMLTVFFKGTLVKRETMSNETNTKSLEFVTSGKIEFILLAASNEPFVEIDFVLVDIKPQASISQQNYGLCQSCL